MMHWLMMGGHGFFIWASYGFAALLLSGLVLWSIRSLRQRERLIAQWQQAPTDAQDGH